MKMKYMLLALAVVASGILGGCGKTQPKEVTKTQQALLCYQELLKAAPALEGEHPELQDASFGDAQNREQFGEHYDQFAVLDLNQDGVPELLTSTVINFRWVPVCVFTYADGKAVLLTDPAEPSDKVTFAQNSSANGAYVTFVCAENHIHSLWSGDTPVGPMEENHAYVLEGTALTAVDCAATEGTFFFDIAKPNTAQNAAELAS